MKLNDMLFLVPSISCGYDDEKHERRKPQKPQPARVIYINEAHRYFVAEFWGPGGQTFREGFPLPVDQRQERIPSPAPDRSKRHGPQFGRKRPK